MRRSRSLRRPATVETNTTLAAGIVINSRPASLTIQANVTLTLNGSLATKDYGANFTNNGAMVIYPSATIWMGSDTIFGTSGKFQITQGVITQTMNTAFTPADGMKYAVSADCEASMTGDFPTYDADPTHYTNDKFYLPIGAKFAAKDADQTQAQKCLVPVAPATFIERTAEGIYSAQIVVCEVISNDKMTTNACSSLAAALEKVSNYGYIRLLADTSAQGELTLTKNLVTLDLNGKTLTVDKDATFTVNGWLSVVNENPLAGGLVVNGSVVANAMIYLKEISYGVGGLIPHAGGNISVGASGTVSFMEAWSNETANALMVKTPGFLTAVNGATVKTGKAYTYNGETQSFDVENAVAKAERVLDIVTQPGSVTNFVDSFDTVAAALAAVKDEGTVTMLQSVSAEKEQNLTIRETTTLDLTASGYLITTNGLVNGGVIKVYQAHLASLEAYANVVGTLLAGSEIKDASSTMSYPMGTTINLTEETLASGNIVPTVTVNVPDDQTLVWKNGVGPYKRMIVYGNVTYAGNIDSGLSTDYKTLLSVSGNVEIVSSIMISNNAAMTVTGTVTLTPEDETTITLADETSTFVNKGELSVNENVRAAADGYGVFRSADGVYSVYRPTVTYSWQPTEVGTVVASNWLDSASTWTNVESGAAVAYGSLMRWLAIPTFSNSERYEFVKWTIVFNGDSQDPVESNPVERDLSVDNVTNYDYTASFQWKSNYTGTVEVKGSPVWDVHEGEDYSKAIVSISEGGTFSSKFENALNVIQVATDGTLVWDFTEGGAPSFSPVKTVTCRGTFKIAFDGTLTNGTYAIMSYVNLSGDKSGSFALTDGKTTKTCTANGDWVYFGAYRFKITDKDNLVTLTVEGNPRTCFVESEYKVTEGQAVKVYVQGGSSDRAVQATVTYQKNTGSYSAAYVDGKKVSFPLTLSWVKGEISAKEILFQTTASRLVDEDKFFTLQLGSPVGEKVLETREEIVYGGDVCRVTITDAGAGVDANYVRALAWPTHGGTVSGGGTLANEKSYRTLTATTKNGSLFAGWYKAKEDNPEVIDLRPEAKVEPYSSNPKQIRVGYDSTVKEIVNKAGTYFAYFTNVLEVAGVVEPTPFDEAGQAAEGVAGVTDWDDVNCVYSTMVGVKFALPVEFTDESGKGRLTITKLPSGLSYSAKTGAISGIPTKAGTYAAQFVASNAAGKHTVNYTFEVAEIPTVAVGTFAGVISDDTNRTGVGSVQFTAGKTGSLSAKVVRRLSGTRSFSVKGYDYIDEDTLGIAMTNGYGEVFEAKLDTTRGWYDTAVVGTAFGGDPKKSSLAKYGETNGTFTAVRNAFSNTDKDAAAQQILAAFNGTYAETLYATNGIGEVLVDDPVGTVQYRVNAQGSVYVVARLARAYDGEKTVAARTFSGTVTAGFTYDDETGMGGAAAALRSGNYLWSTEALLDYSNRDVWGWARYIRPNAADKSKVVDVDEQVGK